MSTAIQQVESLLRRELGRVIVGADNSIRALIIALVARGHVLVQGVPGLGKTPAFQNIDVDANGQTIGLF